MNPRIHILAVLRAAGLAMKMTVLKHEVENRMGKLVGRTEWEDTVAGMKGKGAVVPGVDDDDDETLSIPRT